MSVDAYLNKILRKYQVDMDGARTAGRKLLPILQKWGNGYLLGIDFSGSLAKGTAISLSTDADIFLSASSSTPGTLEAMYSSLSSALSGAGYIPRKQNVSIGVTVNGYSIDLVPGRRISQYGNDHSLYKSKTGTRIQTNVDKHIAHIAQSGRVEEIRLVKIWRTLHGLSFPSFYIELVTIDALRYSRHGDLKNNFWKVLLHLSENLTTKTYVDPANTNNYVSADCSEKEKIRISSQAKLSLQKKDWAEIIW